MNANRTTLVAVTGTATGVVVGTRTGARTDGDAAVEEGR